MKKLVVIIFALISYTAAFAQNLQKEKLSVYRIDTVRTNTWRDEVYASVGVITGMPSDSVAKSDSTVTLFYKKYNSKVTVSKEVYLWYLDHAIKFQEHELKRRRDAAVQRDIWSPTSAGNQQGSGPSGITGGKVITIPRPAKKNFYPELKTI